MKDEARYVCEPRGEEIVPTIDLSAGSAQEYVEDCPVSCRPNIIRVEVDQGGDLKSQAPCLFDTLPFRSFPGE